jgi:hypothetical protein
VIGAASPLGSRITASLAVHGARLSLLGDKQALEQVRDRGELGQGGRRVVFREGWGCRGCARSPMHQHNQEGLQESVVWREQARALQCTVVNLLTT